MPKIKNKSGAKKRFSFTGSGRVKMNQAGKRHGMIKRTNKFIRNAELLSISGLGKCLMEIIIEKIF